MAALSGITNKRFDASSLTALLEKLKGTYGSIQDIIDAINNNTFDVPTEIDVDTTHTVNFIDEAGLRTILQIVKNVKTEATNAVQVLEGSVSEINEQVENNTAGLTGIVDTASTASFTEPTETEVDTTYTVKFFGEDALEAVLQIVKDLKSGYDSKISNILKQLDETKSNVSTLSGVVEVMNEDVNDLSETSASHTTSINEITNWINEFNNKITE